MGRACAVLLIAVALGLVVPAADSASPQTADRPLLIWAKFSLKPHDGFRFRAEAHGGKATLYVERGRQAVSYTAPGAVSTQGIEARFGDLGRISVEFRPDRPGSFCKRHAVSVGGAFVGTIEFDGERGYLHVDADRARGSIFMFDLPRCPGRPRVATTGDTDCQVVGGGSCPAADGRREEEEAEGATLSAFTRRHGRFLVAIGLRSSDDKSKSLTTGGRVEYRGQMRVVRISSVVAGRERFVFDEPLAFATLQPPRPFAGSAQFVRAADGSTSWTGSLSVALLGADPVSLAGPEFTVQLKREIPGD
ncbi:MAG TPA: hypothetical protein VN752_01675 [Solirubrobacterales bacterium]|nr:hypothetical protein [Solirubrobacterales bacterium]